MGDSFDPSGVSMWAVAGGAAGGARQRDVQWGRSLCDGNALSYFTCMRCFFLILFLFL